MMTYDLAAITLLVGAHSVIGTVIMQAQTTWDINPTTIFGVLVSILTTAVVVLWRSNKEKETEIKRLNKTIVDEIKTLHSKIENHE